MQHLYKDFARSSQGLDLEPLELSPDDIIGNAEECRQFRIRLTFGELRRRICEDYTNGFVNAANTMRRLEDEGLYGTPDDFMRIFASGVRILSAGGTR